MKFKILFCYFIFIGCNNPVIIQEQKLDNVSFNLNLPQNSEGYYLLVLDRTKSQTIHNIHGEIYPSIQYKRFEWESNLTFQVGPYIANTTNLRSYTDKEGLFVNSLGPVLEMVGDTMKLEVKWDPFARLDDRYFYNPTESKTFYIILE